MRDGVNPMTAIFDGEEDAVRCPYARFAQLRESDPVSYDAAHDVYVVTRYEDIEKVATQPSLFSNQNPIGPTATHAIEALSRVQADAPQETIERHAIVMGRGNVLLNQDPPVHTRQRRIVNRLLTPRSVARVEDSVRKVCHGLVDGFVDDRPVDLISAYCSPVPTYALLQLLGISGEKQKDFSRWAAALNSVVGANISDEALLVNIEAQSEFWSFCEQEILKRIDEPQDDLLTAVARAHSEGDDRLTLNEAIGLCSQLISAGADTTSNHIAAFALRLCLDKELFSRLKTNPQDLPAHLEEGLRLESPAQGVYRVATQDTELGGVHIPKGAYVYIVYASGNRDEEVFAQPEAYDPSRERLRSHLAFGRGPHTCVGAPLARTVSRVAFEVILERFDEMALQDVKSNPDYDTNYMLRKINSLPVKFRTAMRPKQLSAASV